MIARIKKDDTVFVLTGKDKGKTGKVLKLKLKKEKVLIKDVAVITRHVKSGKQGVPGSIKKEESFIAMSKVMPVCSACKKPTRVNTKMLETGKRARICNRCQEIF